MFEESPELPKKESISISPQEHEPVSYEAALAAARALRLESFEDVYDDENPRAQEALAVIQSWEDSRGLQIRGVTTAEKAADIVKAATLWIDAGYTKPEFLLEALERLNNEYADALRQGDTGIIKFLKDAIEVIEAKIVAVDPREALPAKVKARIEKAHRSVEQGKVLKAIGDLSAALIDPDLKRMSDEQRRQIIETRDALKKSI